MNVRSKLLRLFLTTALTASLIAGNVPAGYAQGPTSPPSLKTVTVPKPDNLADFVKDEDAAIALGKALFWDMQVSSDGIQACASCHFSAGTDNRSKNALNPGLNRINADGTPNPDKTFDNGKGANYQLKPEDYPFHKLADENNRDSEVLRDSNDITGPQGVFSSLFEDIVFGSPEDKVKYKPDQDGFRVASKNTRRVSPRNTPSVINAVFNYRNFWDGRAQNDFNGVDPFGSRNANAFVYKVAGNTIEPTKISLNNSSLASQALGPPLSNIEMSGDGRTWHDIGKKLGQPMNFSLLSLRLLGLKPLGQQMVRKDDSVLGKYSAAPYCGLKTTYEAMIKAAFKPEWYSSKKFVRINDDGSQSIVSKKTTKNTYSMMEYNFSLFFGLAVQEYEATLVSDEAPIDKYAEGNENALTVQQKRGLDVFQTRGCNICHSGAEFTDAAVSRIEQLGEILSIPGLLNIDLGFFNLGNRPSLDDPGIGGKDPFGKPLSVAKIQGLSNSPELGAFKTADLRNVELTAPYMHNGGMLTLDQVVDFYGRSGNFANAGSPDELNILNVIKINFGDNTSTPEVDIDPIKAAQEKQDVVAFLKSLTDERVRYQKAPFDHPQLFVPNGHPGDQNKVKGGKNGNAKDDLMEIKAVGREGGKPIKLFLQQ